MNVKRFFTGMTAALLAVVLFFTTDVAAISAQSGILMDATTGRVLFERNPDRQSLVASTTKIMTALVVCEQCNVLDRVKIPKEAVGIEGSSMYLQEGEVLTVQELLYGLMLRSGNDAAVALAIYCGGTVEGFAGLMNDKAKNLGMTNSHFMNPNGLDAPGHYSTARDLAILSAYAMNNPVFCRTVSTKSVTVGNRVLTNHNKLLWQLEGAEGVKTGYTKAAGRILVSSATRQGRRLIAVTIDAPNDWQDHKELMESGFKNYQIQPILYAGDCVGSKTLIGGVQESVSLLAAEPFSYAITQDEQIEIVISGPSFCYAPVQAGEEAGYAYILLSGQQVGKIPLVYETTVAQALTERKPFLRRIFGG